MLRDGGDHAGKVRLKRVGKAEGGGRLGAVFAAGDQGGVEASHILQQDRRGQQGQVAAGVLGANHRHQAGGDVLHLRAGQADALGPSR